MANDVIQTKPGSQASETKGNVIAVLIAAFSPLIVGWFNESFGAQLEAEAFAAAIASIALPIAGVAFGYTNSRTKVKVADSDSKAKIEIARLDNETERYRLAIMKEETRQLELKAAAKAAQSQPAA